MKKPVRQSLKDIASKVVASLTEEELHGSAVYLDPRPLGKGATFSIRGSAMAVAKPSIMAFIDMQPAANWGHPCRYLLIGIEDGSIASVDAQFPPTGASLRIIHRGEAVEDWMLLSTQQLDEGQL
jgi:hypothetical protein